MRHPKRLDICRVRPWFALPLFTLAAAVPVGADDGWTLPPAPSRQDFFAPADNGAELPDLRRFDREEQSPWERNGDNGERNGCPCENGNGCNNHNGCRCHWRNNGREDVDLEFLEKLRQADPGLHAGGLFRDRPWITAGPEIPEPMVFDMVRPMHARRGEFEVNVLAVFPLRSGAAPVDWAPEVEYAVADGFAFEFEVPFEDTRIDALKYAVQYTFGTGFDNQMIHGFHGIYEHEFDKTSIFTALYMMGLRFDEAWSVLGMFGFRSTIEKELGENFTELINNVSVFADVTDTLIMGVETNMAHNLIGPSSLLIVPQAHWAMTDNLTLQFGGGLQAFGDTAYPVAAFRLIYEF